MLFQCETKAAAVSQRTTEELDKLLARFMELVQQVQGTEAFQTASSQLQSAAEQTAAQARVLARKLAENGIEWRISSNFIQFHRVFW